MAFCVPGDESEIVASTAVASSALSSKLVRLEQKSGFEDVGPFWMLTSTMRKRLPAESAAGASKTDTYSCEVDYQVIQKRAIAASSCALLGKPVLALNEKQT